MTDPSPLIRLKGIEYGYPGDAPVLKGLDLVLEPGDRLGLEGPIGSGKTTLLHLVVGLIRPQAGSVEVFGRERRTEREFWEVRERIGLLFQDPEDQLFCPTVAEDVAFGPLNLGLPRDRIRPLVAKTLAGLGLDGFEERITHRLSGGEKRLVSLATVLAMRPEVLLLDEPATGLDPVARARLLEHLQALPQAMILVSHDRSLLEALANRRSRLVEGRAVLDPSPSHQ